MNLGETSSSDLFRSNGLCSVPQGVSSIFLEPVLGAHCKYRKEELGSGLGG